VTPENSPEFEKLLYGVPFGCIGSITDSPRLKVTGTCGSTIIDEDINSLKEAWQKPLNW